MFKDIPDSFAERILISISEPSLIYDENREVCWVNPAGEMFLGHSMRFLKGKRCTQLIPDQSCLLECPVEKAFDTGEEVSLELKSFLGSPVHIEAIPYGKNRTRFVLAIITPLNASPASS